MASCLFQRTGVAAIDTPATIIVVARWVSLWYSRRPHNALVVFVGKAALWHWGGGGLLPWPPSLRSRCLSCKALASLVENDIHSTRCDWQQWCRRLSLLVTTVPSSDAYVAFKARFWLFNNYSNGIRLIISFYFSINCNQLSQMTNWSMLIGGVVRCRLVQPNSTSETSSHALICGWSNTWSCWCPDE